MDSWRFRHPQDRDYTYFSSTHQTYSRLDYFFIQHKDLPLIENTFIDNILLSDHAPLHLSVDIMPPRAITPSWRLNEALLQDPLIKDDIDRELSSFFELNGSTPPSPLITWEAHKCVIRGVLIKHGSRIKKDATSRTSHLLLRLHTLESQHKKSLAIQSQTELLQVRTELNDILFNGVKKRLLKGRRTLYEYSDKPGKLLANALKGSRNKNFMPHILSSSGNKLGTSTAIAAEFQTFYEDLYNLNADPSSNEHLNAISRREQIATYIRDSGMPSISATEAAQLEHPIRLEELASVLKSAPPGKAPGPDGFTIPYYKTFSEALSGPFLQAFNSILRDDPFPTDSLRAWITVIPKPDRDPALCSNYRPIALLNVDMKLFAKIVANRLLLFLPSLIHNDQTGFIPQREAKDNTVRALGIIHQARMSGSPLMLLSTDAEKAFDRVDWGFLTGVLRHIGLGDHMMKWILALYSSPSAAVRVNETRSPYFKLSNGTRQGCPLSPLIFALTLEPFLQTIRNSVDVVGFQTSSGVHKVAAYADDLLFFLSTPHRSISNLLNALETYGRLYNFKVNLTKSAALNVSLPTDVVLTLKRDFHFRWEKSRLKYLGIFLTADSADIYPANFSTLLSTITTNLKSWHALHITWFGRCAAVKMNLLPRVLYLMQALPVKLPKTFFKRLHREVISFIWGNKHPRLSRHILSLPRDRGGVGLPDFFRYYSSIHLHRLLDRCTRQKVKRWVDLERGVCPYPIEGLPWLSSTLPPVIQSHPLISTTILVTQKIFKSTDISPSPSPLTPIIGDPDFAPGMEPTRFRPLFKNDNFRIMKFRSQDIWLSISDIQALTDPPWISGVPRKFDISLGQFQVR